MNTAASLPTTSFVAERTEVLLSAIEHYSYCPRQCALIHVEQSYAENHFTVRGSQAHERVHAGEESSTDGVPVLRALPLWSEAYGLRGRSDAVEMRPEGPFPIEYKVGKRHSEHAALQLCAEALCLEEMLCKPVPSGALYSVESKRRTEIAIDDALRARTLSVVDALRTLLDADQLPPAPNDARCRGCSLSDICLPEVTANHNRIRGLQGALYRIDDVADVED